MTSVVLACLWVIAAQVIALLPSRDKHWRAAYVLIAIGVPLLVFLWWENGVFVALVGLIAGMSILRWPVYYLYRWLRRVVGRPVEDERA